MYDKQKAMTVFYWTYSIKPTQMLIHLEKDSKSKQTPEKLKEKDYYDAMTIERQGARTFSTK